jgi:transforming growth factor-beta-induced protein
MRSIHTVLRAAMIAGVAMLPVACGGDSASESEVQVEIVEAAPGTIVEVAADAGTFNTLLAAATAAGLVETLSGPGPFTVFAPTDEAFAALPEGTVEALLADIETLTAILLYHVVAGEVTAEQVVTLTEAATVNGANVSIMAHDGMVMINNATVIAADVKASNGIIHVINAVLLPPTE